MKKSTSWLLRDGHIWTLINNQSDMEYEEAKSNLCNKGPGCKPLRNLLGNVHGRRQPFLPFSDCAIRHCNSVCKWNVSTGHSYNVVTKRCTSGRTWRYIYICGGISTDHLLFKFRLRHSFGHMKGVHRIGKGEHLHASALNSRVTHQSTIDTNSRNWRNQGGSGEGKKMGREKQLQTYDLSCGNSLPTKRSARGRLQDCLCMFDREQGRQISTYLISSPPFACSSTFCTSWISSNIRMRFFSMSSWERGAGPAVPFAPSPASAMTPTQAPAQTAHTQREDCKTRNKRARQEEVLGVYY